MAVGFVDARHHRAAIRVLSDVAELNVVAGDKGGEVVALPRGRLELLRNGEADPIDKPDPLFDQLK